MPSTSLRMPYQHPQNQDYRQSLIRGSEVAVLLKLPLNAQATGKSGQDFETVEHCNVSWQLDEDADKEKHWGEWGRGMRMDRIIRISSRNHDEHL